MVDKVIDNPILNRPYDEPSRHFAFDDEGITDRIEDSRRPSSYFGSRCGSMTACGGCGPPRKSPSSPRIGESRHERAPADDQGHVVSLQHRDENHPALVWHQAGRTAEVIAELLDLPAPAARHAPALARTAPTDLWLPPGFTVAAPRGL